MHKVHITELEALTYKTVKNFIYQYRGAKPTNPKISVERYLSCDAAEMLEGQGIDIKDDQKIMKYFDKYVKEKNGRQ